MTRPLGLLAGIEPKTETVLLHYLTLFHRPGQLRLVLLSDYSLVIRRKAFFVHRVFVVRRCFFGLDSSLVARCPDKGRY